MAEIHEKISSLQKDIKTWLSIASKKKLNKELEDKYSNLKSLYKILDIFNKSGNSKFEIRIPQKVSQQEMQNILNEVQNDLMNLQMDNIPLVKGDMEVHFNIDFPLKQIIVLDKNNEQIAYSNSTYLEVYAKTNCVPSGESYTIKLIGQNPHNTIIKKIKKEVDGDLAIYAHPKLDNAFNNFLELFNANKHLEAVQYVIDSYGLDKNQCPAYKIKVTIDDWAGFTTGGDICGEQLIDFRTGFLKVASTDKYAFARFVSAVGHEFIHVRQRGDLGLENHNEREFLAYYWEVFQDGLPSDRHRRKFACKQALFKYAKMFDKNKKKKYKTHIKEISDEKNSKY